MNHHVGIYNAHSSRLCVSLNAYCAYKVVEDDLESVAIPHTRKFNRVEDVLIAIENLVNYAILIKY